MLLPINIARSIYAIFFAFLCLFGLVKTNDLPPERYEYVTELHSDDGSNSDVGIRIYFGGRKIRDNYGDGSFSDVVVTGTSIKASGGSGLSEDNIALFKFTPKHAGRSKVTIFIYPMYDDDVYSKYLIYTCVFEVDKDLNVTLINVKEAVKNNVRLAE